MAAAQTAVRPRTDPNVLIATFVTNLLGLALPIVMIQVYDRIIPNAAYETMTVLAIGLGIAVICDFAVRLARGRLIMRAAARFEEAAYERAFDTIVFDRGPDTADLSKGELLDRLASIDRVRKHYGNDGMTALVDIPFVALFVILIALISPVLGGAVLALAVFSVIVVSAFRVRIRTLLDARKERDRRRHSFLTETLETIEMIKSCGIEGLLERRYDALMAGSAAITYDLSRRVHFVQGVVTTIGLAAPVIMAGVGSYLMVQGEITMGALAASVLLTSRVIQPTLRVEALWAGDRDIRVSKQDIALLCPDLPAPFKGRPLPQVDSLTLCDVTWQPDPERPPVLKSISLDLAKGDCLLITGEEGAGRSSLLALMGGLIQPTHGKVLLNGAPLSVYDDDDLAQRVGYLSSENTLLHGSLLDNLTAFQPERYARSSQHLMQELGIDTFFQRHPEGLKMMVSAHGGGALPKSIHDSAVIISGLVTEPDLILFDEANAGLDRAMDDRLRALLQDRRADSILVLLTNRPSYQALANRRVHLAKGTVVNADPTFWVTCGAST